MAVAKKLSVIEELDKLDAKAARAEFKEVIKLVNTVPVRMKTQYPLYIEVRTMQLLKTIARIDNVSVQSIIREQINNYIEGRVFKEKK